MNDRQDLISRQDVIDAYGDWYVEEGPAEGFIGSVKQLLEGLPSAQPEVLMCKDCKQFRDHRCMKANHHVSGWGNCMEVFGAERREE